MGHMNTKRGQGMTEYIILVGLIAILMIGAVGLYGFRVDEAIQGSERAVRRTTQEMGPDRTVTDNRGTDWDLYGMDDGRTVAVPPGSRPESTSPTYDSNVHGS